MKVKYDTEADILIFILQDDLPYEALSEQGGVYGTERQKS